MNSMELSKKKKFRKCEQKIEADPGNDITIADSYKLLSIKKCSILDVASFLGFRVSQISNTNPIQIKSIFHSVLLIPDLLMLSFLLDSKQVQGYGIVCMLIVL